MAGPTGNPLASLLGGGGGQPNIEIEGGPQQGGQTITVGAFATSGGGVMHVDDLLRGIQNQFGNLQNIILSQRPGPERDDNMGDRLKNLEDWNRRMQEQGGIAGNRGPAGPAGESGPSGGPFYNKIATGTPTDLQPRLSREGMALQEMMDKITLGNEVDEQQLELQLRQREATINMELSLIHI